MKSYLFVLSMILLAGLTACKKDDPEIQTEFKGDQVSIGDGLAWAFVRTDEQQTPVAIGLQIEEAALSNLPTGSPFGDEFVLTLPGEVNVPPYNHITLDWNEHGHDPLGVYDLPHFDMHFYFMSMTARDAIGPFDTIEFNKPLPAEYLAPMYLETPGGVPRMGAHIIDLLSPEIAGTGTFTHTFIYGKYNGEVNFLEPMITLAFLQSKASVNAEIRQPQAWQRSGYYPTRYTVDFDEAAGVYTILLTDLQEK